MGKVILGVLIGGVVGYLLIPKISRAETVRRAEEGGLPPMARMARDFRRSCRDLDPMMRSLEASLGDGSLSISESAALIGHVRRLM